MAETLHSSKIGRSINSITNKSVWLRCALCQEYRELKHRGFDVSIGDGFSDVMSSSTLTTPLMRRRGTPKSNSKWVAGKKHNKMERQALQTPLTQKDAIEGMVQELLDSGVIRPSNSLFASPIVMVTKKDNS
nr:reverse transcriptase [Tanacetum cinerariifolium]